MCTFPMCASITMLLVYMCFFFYILLGHLLAKRIDTFTFQKYLHVHVYKNKRSDQMQMFINIRIFRKCRLSLLHFKQHQHQVLLHPIFLSDATHAFVLPASHRALAGIRAALMEGSSLHIQANSLHNYKTIQQQLKQVNISSLYKISAAIM